MSWNLHCFALLGISMTLTAVFLFGFEALGVSARESNRPANMRGADWTGAAILKSQAAPIERAFTIAGEVR